MRALAIDPHPFHGDWNYVYGPEPLDHSISIGALSVRLSSDKKAWRYSYRKDILRTHNRRVPFARTTLLP